MKEKEEENCKSAKRENKYFGDNNRLRNLD